MLHMLFCLVNCTLIMPVAAVGFVAIEKFGTVPVLTGGNTAVVIRKNSLWKLLGCDSLILWLF